MAVVSGTAGDDTIKFGATGTNGTSQGSTHGDDYLDGKEGNDYVFGGAGNDVMLGSGGNDVLNGGLGDDRLAGGTGDDFLDGGDGHDFLRGGTGNDVFLWDDADFEGAWTTVANPFAIGAPSTFVLGASQSASTTSTYAGNEDFDVINATNSASGVIDLTGKAVATIEAVGVKSTNSGDQTVKASLTEMRQENQSDLSSGSVAGNDRATAAAFVLGGQAGDSIDLVGAGWSFAGTCATTGLSADELLSLRSVVGTPLSTGDSNPNTMDLQSYVFTNGDNSVTVWTDLSLSHFSLNGSDIMIYA